MATSGGGSPDRLVLTGGGLIFGALLGRILVPLVSWLAVVLLGFASTSLAVFTVLAGQQVATSLTYMQETRLTRRGIERLLDQLAALPIFHNQEALALTAVGGLLGAIIAARFYSLLITTAVSTVGAALLTVAVPLWPPALNGTLAVTENAFTSLSSGLFVVLLAAGLLVQAYRYRDDLTIPGLGDEYDPLAGE